MAFLPMKKVGGLTLTEVVSESYSSLMTSYESSVLDKNYKLFIVQINTYGAGSEVTIPATTHSNLAYQFTNGLFVYIGYNPSTQKISLVNHAQSTTGWNGLRIFGLKYDE